MGCSFAKGRELASLATPLKSLTLQPCPPEGHALSSETSKNSPHAELGRLLAEFDDSRSGFPHITELGLECLWLV